MTVLQHRSFFRVHNNVIKGTTSPGETEIQA